MREPRLGVWPPLPPTVYARAAAHTLPFPLQEPGCLLFARARHALWHGVRALGLPGADVLVPAYHHGSEIEALVRAGISCRFYGGAGDLQPDEDELEALSTPRTRALYLIHYLGFPQDMQRWRRWCDDRRLVLIEDAAQAWLASRDGQAVGAAGDLAIFCLYKTFGLPDGGALVTRAPAAAPTRSSGIGARPLARKHAAWVSGRWRALAPLAASLEAQTPYVAADDFALGDPSLRPAAATLLLLPRIATAHAAASRRANYELLREELGELLVAPFADLGRGASPFAFPVETAHKAELLDRLTAANVRALDFWSVPHPSLPADRFPDAARRRARTVALPVHQELAPGSVERMARVVTGRAGSAPLRLERLDALDTLRDEWDELAGASRNVFATWEWVSLWWRHFAGGRPLLAWAVRSARGRLAAILPLYRWRSRPLRVVRFLGHGPGDQLGPICAPGDRTTAARGLRRALAETTAQWDLFLGEALPADEGWDGLLGARVVSRTGFPVVRFQSSSWDDFLASKSANFRQQVRSRQRKLAHAHDVRYRLAGDPGELQRDLDTLFALHTARFGVEESAFGGAHEEARPSGPRESFHRDFAVSALERGWLRLWFLEVDGAAVAAWYGFRYAGAECYYQAGRDVSWDRYSVGFLLLVHSMRAALEDGVREYRLLRGDEPYKYRFATEDRGLETVAITRGAAGAAALSAGIALRRVRRLSLALRGPLDQ